jgi:hypothetical protein
MYVGKGGVNKQECCCYSSVVNVGTSIAEMLYMGPKYIARPMQGLLVVALFAKSFWVCQAA